MITSTKEDLTIKYLYNKQLCDCSFLTLQAHEDSLIKKNEVTIIPTGLYVQIPVGYEMLVFSHSDLLATDSFVLNAPGTIDSDFRGEVQVISTSITQTDIQIHKGQNIALALFSPIVKTVFKESMEELDIQTINYSRNPIPCYQSMGASGQDLFSNTEIAIPPMECRDVPIGISVNIPSSFHMEIRSRSGLAAKNSIAVMGAPIVFEGTGTFTGQIYIPIMNLGKQTFCVTNGMRIAQAVFVPLHQAKMINANSLDESQRGEGGFGSTGF